VRLVAVKEDGDRGNGDVDAAAYGLHQLCRNPGNETA
jgi:hypothetical protein